MTPSLTKRIATLLALALASTSLSGCAAALFGGAAAVVTSARQERSVGRQFDDAVVQANLEGNFIRQDGVLFRKINTTVIEGRVYLKGNVETEEDRLNATRIAWNTPGVVEVYNDVTVNQPETIADAANDFWISTKARTALLGEADVKDVNYTIETRNGVVYLMGVAQNNYERDLAVQTLRGVDGIRDVVDYTVLKDDPRRGAVAANGVRPVDPQTLSPATGDRPYSREPVEIRTMPAGS
jgi:osmotically-inducible protein OsmY